MTENDKPHSDLWTALTTLPRPSKIVDFPRNYPGTNEPIGKLEIRVLTQHEQSVAASEADRLAKRIMKDSQKREEANIGYEDLYNNEASVQVVFHACRVVGRPDEPAFPDVASLRKHLTTTELGVLTTAYLEVQAELGPVIGRMTKAEMDDLLDRIERDAERNVPLHLYSPAMKNDLLRYSARRYSISRTDRSSAGSQPDDPDSEI